MYKNIKKKKKFLKVDKEYNYENIRLSNNMNNSQ